MGMGIPKEKVCIVSNTPELGRFGEGRPTFPGSMAWRRSGLIFLYIGILDLYRGVQIAIRGFSKVLEHEPNAVLFIVGSGKGEGELKRIAGQLGIHNSVVFEGYQPHKLIPDYVASCDVGVIPHFACSLWNNTVPNKLFDYMCMAKPVLSSDAVPVKRILTEEQCGLTYESNDPPEFGRQAVRFLDRNLRQRFGENGLKAVKRKYNWAVDGERMVRKIESLGRPGGSCKNGV
jgi:glycosyltransferase involved in cell wall biosynthesis